MPWSSFLARIRGSDVCADSQADPDQLCKESFFAVSAFKFTNADGVSRYGRYRVLPEAGNEYLDEAGAAAQTSKLPLRRDQERVAKEPVRFRIAVQLAEDGDTVDDATVRWPEDRPQLSFGEISLKEITPEQRRRAAANHLRSHPSSGWASRPRPIRSLSRGRISI
jgi:catalase